MLKKEGFILFIYLFIFLGLEISPDPLLIYTLKTNFILFRKYSELYKFIPTEVINTNGYVHEQKKKKKNLMTITQPYLSIHLSFP